MGLGWRVRIDLSEALRYTRAVVSRVLAPLCALFCVLATPRISHADDPPTGWATLGGGAVALVPMAIGSSIFAQNADDRHRKAGVLTMLSGLALAPIVSHLAVREWVRAAIFGAVPVACAVAMTVLVELQPSVTGFGTPQTRLTFGLLISFATLSSGIGLIDTLSAGRRATERKRLTRSMQPRAIVLPLPFAASGGGGLAIGGIF